MCTPKKMPRMQLNVNEVAQVKVRSSTCSGTLRVAFKRGGAVAIRLLEKIAVKYLEWIWEKCASSLTFCFQCSISPHPLPSLPY